ncbi:GlsB/YeaQ/YmgE family stress response membrane protein [Streptomyces europaeiscabiei]|uniref:GlsB/YeaQ/YmgE family stress response membrane protein n=1 Tax=Streptomyces europaeiscabiei TaxID=146819 RepID=UPI002E161C0A|nr:GlsB/YeaQ/YmgE family stress response membrane protein [Streptomyces europaeiscabiei]
MGVIAWLVLGLLAGAIAKAVPPPGRDLIGTPFIGIVGALLGGWLSTTFLDRPVHQKFFDAAAWGSAIAGALVLLIGFRTLFSNSRD